MLSTHHSGSVPDFMWEKGRMKWAIRQVRYPRQLKRQPIKTGKKRRRPKGLENPP